MMTNMAIENSKTSQIILPVERQVECAYLSRPNKAGW